MKLILLLIMNCNKFNNLNKSITNDKAIEMIQGNKLKEFIENISEDQFELLKQEELQMVHES